MTNVQVWDQKILKLHVYQWNLNDIPKACMRAGEVRALGNRSDEIGTPI